MKEWSYSFLGFFSPILQGSHAKITARLNNKRFGVMNGRAQKYSLSIVNLVKPFGREGGKTVVLVSGQQFFWRDLWARVHRVECSHVIAVAASALGLTFLHNH